MDESISSVLTNEKPDPQADTYRRSNDRNSWSATFSEVRSVDNLSPSLLICYRQTR